ncbi:hypothetical protein ACNAN0_03865 [Agrilactobacillus fermenti]|uniref:hypothetical protein n=1 Tax=Agrilactobacillus fermenti TaxID=2586909 RepID=UPI003A5C4796
MVEHPRNAELLQQIKLLNSRPEGSDETQYNSILTFVLAKVINDVANYIHVPVLELPEALDMTIIGLVTQYLVTNQLLVPVADKTGNVASLSEGDTSVTFKTPAEVYTALQSVNTITDNYVGQLNNFRKVKWD